MIKFLNSQKLSTKRMFSTTPIRHVIPTGGAEVELALILYAIPVSSMFFMAIIWATVTIAAGELLATRLSESAVEAQDLVMFPENLQGPFFFVPVNTMNLLNWYILRLREGVAFWSNLQNYETLSANEVIEFIRQLDLMLARIRQVDFFSDLITELDDTTMNANLEHLHRHRAELNLLIEEIEGIKLLIHREILGLPH